MKKKPCKKCEGKGWIIHPLRSYPRKDSKPYGAYWFNRGEQGEKPVVCRACETVEASA